VAKPEIRGGLLARLCQLRRGQGRGSVPGCASTTKNGSIRALATARRGRSGETLAFAHIPTGTTANKGFDIHHKSKFVELTIALTAIGPTPKSAELRLNARLRVFHKSGSTSRDGIDRQDHADAGDGKRENYRNTVRSTAVFCA